MKRLWDLREFREPRAVLFSLSLDGASIGTSFKGLSTRSRRPQIGFCAALGSCFRFSGIGGYARINVFLRHGALYDHIASLCKRNFSQLCWRLVVASVTDFEGLPFAGFSNACPFQVLSRPVLHQGFPRFRSSLHKGLGIVTVQPITSVPFNAIVTATTTLAAATAAMMA